MKGKIGIIQNIKRELLKLFADLCHIYQRKHEKLWKYIVSKLFLRATRLSVLEKFGKICDSFGISLTKGNPNKVA